MSRCLARAVRDGLDWVHLADRETALFREDMTALGVVIPPDHYLGVTESIDLIVADVEALLANGNAVCRSARRMPRTRRARTCISTSRTAPDSVTSPA
jgi:cysteinyl-tRNA synthetase